MLSRQDRLLHTKSARLRSAAGRFVVAVGRLYDPAPEGGMAEQFGPQEAIAPDKGKVF